LAPYSRDLNPVERVSKLMRRLATHNRHFPTLDEIMDAVRERCGLVAIANISFADVVPSPE